jgi:stage II sporulation SpoM-like protein
VETQDLVLVQGMRDTREALSRWGAQPGPVLRSWLLGAVAISTLLLLAVLAVASAVPPDLGFLFVPSLPQGFELEAVLRTMGRNSLVLALHAFACVAGFIAGSSLPLSAEGRRGISRWVHERARPVAFAWVVAVTCFSLVTQAYALGVIGSTLAFSAGISPGLLLLTALPHALLELTAVFLPLAAWTIASRRDEWDQLLAATFVTVGLAIPMLLISATWETYVWPYLLRSASPTI